MANVVPSMAGVVPVPPGVAWGASPHMECVPPHRLCVNIYTSSQSQPIESDGFSSYNEE